MNHTYYTFVSVNKKVIRVEETEKEHEERIKRLRKMQFAQKKAAERKAMGIVNGVSVKCPKCGNQYPYSRLPKYQECPKCAILNMYK